jgi:hypothetical protein
LPVPKTGKPIVSQPPVSEGLKPWQSLVVVSPGECDENAAKLPLGGAAKEPKLVNSRLPSEGWIFLQQSMEKRAQVSLDPASALWQDLFESVDAKSSRLATPAGLEPATCRLEGGFCIFNINNLG